jgi:hypothetical protein
MERQIIDSDRVAVCLGKMEDVDHRGERTAISEQRSWELVERKGFDMAVLSRQYVIYKLAYSIVSRSFFLIPVR